MSLLSQLFFPPARAESSPVFQKCTVIAKVAGFSFGLLSLVFAAVGYLLGTVSTIAVIAALLLSLSMFAATITGGIGFVLLPIVVVVGVVSAASRLFNHGGYRI